MKKLEEVEKLLEGTTPGPWRVERMDCGDYFGDRIGPEVTGELLGVSSADARLLAAAPDLAKVCRELLSENGLLKVEVALLREEVLRLRRSL